MTFTTVTKTITHAELLNSIVDPDDLGNSQVARIEGIGTSFVAYGLAESAGYVMVQEAWGFAQKEYDAIFYTAENPQGIAESWGTLIMDMAKRSIQEVSLTA